MLRRQPPFPDYAELHCRSNFSFLTGASHPEELVAHAKALGYQALALTDECSLSGVVRAHVEAQRQGLHLIVGAEMQLAPSVLPAAWSLWMASRSPLTVAASSAATDVEGAATPSAVPSAAPHAAPFVLAASAPAVAFKPAPNSQPQAGEPGPRLVLLAMNGRGYGNLVQWITVCRRRASKGQYQALMGDLEGKVPDAPTLTGLPGCLALLLADEVLGSPQPFRTLLSQVLWLKTWFDERAVIALRLQRHPHDAELVELAQQVSVLTGVPIAAVGGVRMHLRSRKPLLDALTATRLRCTVVEAGHALASNAEAHLRSRARLSLLYRPEWLARTVQLAQRCQFSLNELRYQYPREITPEGHTARSWLRQLTEEGLVEHYPEGVPAKVRDMVEGELALIAQLDYEAYFLTVADLVRWARSRGILCQGRGSAANSAVCYCLGVTAVDPDKVTLLFGRFLSAERNEPPDIDVDFEHDRREEVIQYIYRRYGRHRAALTAVFISYRPRSALRDMGRALGLDPDRIQALAKSQHWFDGRQIHPDRLRETGFDPDSRLCRLWVELTQTLVGFPRHLSQHPGGFIIARESLMQLVPVENAAMEGRSVIQWDKDDLDALNMLKVDVLALGMLSAIRRALQIVAAKLGRPMALHQIPREDPATYEMLCHADSIGVFQVESRAQMSMLPRLQPRCYYDLVVEVAIVRPGPIQGGMVHPYLQRRSGAEPEDYPHDEVRPALERTKGIPIFQEQVMQLAMVAAEFTPGEADQLRRAMAAWKRKGGLQPFYERLVGRMVQRGYQVAYAERIFEQIKGFGEYGFPESHAASFALLVYASAWLKRHHPDAFLAALLNSQPMGFYAPAQLVRDAREHGVPVLPVCLLHSQWDTVLEGPLMQLRASEPGAGQGGGEASGGAEEAPLQAVRLGFSRITGFGEKAAERIVAARAEAPFSSPEDLTRRAALTAHELQLLAAADALRALVGHRHRAAWAVAGVDTRATALLRETRTHEQDPAEAALAEPAPGATVLADYRSQGLSLSAHPLSLLRKQLAAFKVQPAAVLRHYPDGRLARASGIVTHRQRPETAKGVIFVTLEDETGSINVIVWPQVAEAQRRQLLASTLLTVYGIWQCQGEVRHLVARRLEDHSALLQGLNTHSRDFQ